MYTRRDFGRAALAGLPALAWGRIDPRYKGVTIGVQSYSFRDRPLDAAIAAMREIGLGSCELWSGHIEPQPAPGGNRPSRAAIREWRLGPALDDARRARQKFDSAGIGLQAISMAFREDATGAEMTRMFEIAKALGVKAITSSGTVSMARRVDELASKHKIVVAMHNHSRVEDPNEFATPASFAKALEGASPYIRVNLDIGHFWAGNNDPVEYLERHHDKVYCLHIKDRGRNQGPNTPFGEADTPIKEVVRLLRDRKWDIPANIEYEYKGADTVAEVRRCFEYVKRALD
jgi:sugar phosphate isomerase/epimerase